MIRLTRIVRSHREHELVISDPSGLLSPDSPLRQFNDELLAHLDTRVAEHAHLAECAVTDAHVRWIAQHAQHAWSVLEEIATSVEDDTIDRAGFEIVRESHTCRATAQPRRSVRFAACRRHRVLLERRSPSLSARCDLRIRRRR